MSAEDEFTRLVNDEWYGTVCPEDEQEEIFASLYDNELEVYGELAPYHGRTMCNDIDCESFTFNSFEPLIQAAINKYLPGHTEVKPVFTATPRHAECAAYNDNGAVFQGKDTDGVDVLFIFDTMDHGYFYSVSLLGTFKLENASLPSDNGDLADKLYEIVLESTDKLYAAREDQELSRAEWDTMVEHLFSFHLFAELHRIHTEELQLRSSLTGIAMSLHERLGTAAEIACIGEDNLLLVTQLLAKM